MVMSASARRAIGDAQRQRWARQRATKQPKAPTPLTNGVVLETRLILHFRDQEFHLTADEARHIQDMLNAMFPAKLPISTEPV
jgi:hypothetical protein